MSSYYNLIHGKMANKEDSANFLFYSLPKMSLLENDGYKMMFFSIIFMYIKENFILIICKSSPQTLENVQPCSDARNAAPVSRTTLNAGLMPLGSINDSSGLPVICGPITPIKLSLNRLTSVCAREFVRSYCGFKKICFSFTKCYW